MSPLAPTMGRQRASILRFACITHTHTHTHTHTRTHTQTHTYTHTHTNTHTHTHIVLGLIGRALPAIRRGWICLSFSLSPYLSVSQCLSLCLCLCLRLCLRLFLCLCHCRYHCLYHCLINEASLSSARHLHTHETCLPTLVVGITLPLFILPPNTFPQKVHRLRAWSPLVPCYPPRPRLRLRQRHELRQSTTLPAVNR